MTNQSRDWIILKLEFRLAFDTDLRKVRTLVKEISKQLEAMFYCPRLRRRRSCSRGDRRYGTEEQPAVFVLTLSFRRTIAPLRCRGEWAVKRASAPSIPIRSRIAHGARTGECATVLDLTKLKAGMSRTTVSSRRAPRSCSSSASALRVGRGYWTCLSRWVTRHHFSDRRCCDRGQHGSGFGSFSAGGNDRPSHKGHPGSPRRWTGEIRIGCCGTITQPRGIAGARYVAFCRRKSMLSRGIKSALERLAECI